ncbi:hypothetical protein Tco_0331820 [Tanacetum coccineum]
MMMMRRRSPSETMPDDEEERRTSMREIGGRTSLRPYSVSTKHIVTTARDSIRASYTSHSASEAELTRQLAIAKPADHHHSLHYPSTTSIPSPSSSLPSPPLEGSTRVKDRVTTASNVSDTARSKVRAPWTMVLAQQTEIGDLRASSCKYRQAPLMRAPGAEDSTVTYTEVSSPFEDLSDIGSPGVDGPPVMPEDPYAYVVAAFQAPPSPDYLRSSHCLLLSHLLPTHQDTFTDSDPEEDPEEYPTDYPADGGDDDDDDDESSDDDEDDDDDIEEDEDPTLTSHQPTNRDTTRDVYSSLRPLFPFPSEAEQFEPSTYHLSTSIPETPPQGHHYFLPITLPTSSPPLLLPSTDYRADVPEVGECSSAPTARPTGGFRPDYGFCGTWMPRIRREPDRDDRLRILTVWEDPDEYAEEIPVTAVAEWSRMTKFCHDCKGRSPSSSFRAQTPIPLPSEAEVDRLLAIPTPPSSQLTSLSSPLTQIPSPPLPVSSPLPISPPPLLASLTHPLGYRAAMIRLRTVSPSTSHPLPLPLLIILPHTRASMAMMRAAAPSTYCLAPRSPPLLLPSNDCGEDVPEVTLPPRKRLCITLGPRYEIGECSSAYTARPTRGFRAD